MSTIFDVAKLAGVSKSTVSRVINGQDKVKPETRQAVEEAMNKLNYTPSYFAQGIKTGKTKTIAVFVPDITSQYYSHVFRGAEQVALQNGYLAIMLDTAIQSGKEIDYMKEMLKRKIDGVIYHTFQLDPKNNYYFLSMSEKLPIVFMDYGFSDIPNISYVVTEPREATIEAIGHLVKTGRKRIAYTRFPSGITVSSARYEAYKAGLAKYGLEFRPEYTCSFKERLDVTKLGIAGGISINYYLTLKEKPDAILYPNDEMAIGAIKQIRALNLRIPQDFAVVGYDNIPMCEIVSPSLTTIAQPMQQLGQQAAKIVIEKLKGNRIEDRIKLPAKFIIREST